MKHICIICDLPIGEESGDDRVAFMGGYAHFPCTEGSDIPEEEEQR